MRTVLASSLLSIAVFGGCVSVNLVPHTDPTSGPVAKLQLRTESDGFNHSIVHYKGPLSGCACSAEPGEVLAILRNRMIFTSLGADQGKNVNEVTILIPADGSDFRLMMPVADYTASSVSGPIITVRSRMCQAHVSFVPLPGRQYEAVHNYAKLPCSFEVRELKDGGIATPVPVRNHPPCVHRDDASDPLVRHAKEVCAANPEQFRPVRP